MDRVDALRARLPEAEIDALLVTRLSDVAYVSGFRGSNGALLVAAGQQVLVTDFRYRTQAGEQAPGWELVEMAPGTDLYSSIAQVVAPRALPRVGFQSDQVTVAACDKLQEKLKEAEAAVELKPANGLVTELREVKEPVEIAAIRRAAELADRTMEQAYALARPGVSERELKAQLDYFMITHGATRPSFEMIVASGPNSALPHAPVSDRRLEAGDLVTFDLGAVVDGYCSDLTRTVSLGRASAEQEALYELVYRAQIAALAAIRPGVKGKDVDEVARTIIADAGHGDHFGHGLGHGVGIDIHEGPRLAVGVEKELAAGMVATVEPGVYVEGLGGVRIEDLVVVTEEGREIISRVAKPGRVMVVGTADV